MRLEGFKVYDNERLLRKAVANRKEKEKSKLEKDC